MLKKRLELKPCFIGLRNNCCKNCLLGPCIVINKDGVCGAKKELVNSRNLVRTVAGGTSAHVGHAYHLLKFLKKDYPNNYIKKKAPSYLYKKWSKLGILPKVKYEHFKEISESLHATTMGVNSDYKDMIKWCMKLGILDGYYGMYLATELEDREYGKPKIKKGELNLGVIDESKINIAVHGHELMLVEELKKEVDKHKDINLVGVCCTGSALLNRHGIDLAANFVLQEEVVRYVECMVVDVQCVMPSLSGLCECFNTKLITTNDLGKMERAIHLPVKNKENAKRVSKIIIKIARENRKNNVTVKKEKKKCIVGFTESNLNLKKIKEDLRKGKLKGVIAVIGCVNPRVKENWVKFYEKLSKDYLILTSGCVAFEFGKEGLLDGKNILHMGSCVNNSRIAEVFKKLSNKITDENFLVSCPMPVSEKSIAIGFFFASLGVDVHFGYSFLDEGKVVNFLKNTLKKEFDSRIFIGDRKSLKGFLK